MLQPRVSTETQKTEARRRSGFQRLCGGDTYDAGRAEDVYNAGPRLRREREEGVCEVLKKDRLPRMRKEGICSRPVWEGIPSLQACVVCV